jgi:hypothetical protein
MLLRFALLFGITLSVPALALERAHAVDGDTIRVDGERVRVMGLDAPEMRGQCPLEVTAARRAKDRRAELVAGGVTLRPHGRDRYRRLLAVVEDSRGRDVAALRPRLRAAHRRFRGHDPHRHGRHSYCAETLTPDFPKGLSEDTPAPDNAVQHEGGRELTWRRIGRGAILQYLEKHGIEVRARTRHQNRAVQYT